MLLNHSIVLALLLLVMLVLLANKSVVLLPCLLVCFLLASVQCLINFQPFICLLLLVVLLLLESWFGLLIDDVALLVLMRLINMWLLRLMLMFARSNKLLTSKLALQRWWSIEVAI
jgi:hypothetical protein